MTRISMIGNAGGGKSMLAAAVGRILQLPVFTVDDVQWEPGWQPAPPERVAIAQAQWLARDGWVIDGWGSWELIEQRFAAADTIIFIDFPLSTHMRWVRQRQEEVQRGGRNDWTPPGCDAASAVDRLQRTMQYVDSVARPLLQEMLTRSTYASRTVMIRSPEELEQWRESLGAGTE
ncbi:MAG: hypothetical protein ABIT38_05145 [Gemmatimonadaceae bacterium]